MKISLHGFGSMRALRGIGFEFSAPLTVREFRAYLQTQLSIKPGFSELVILLSSCAFANNEQVLTEDTLLNKDQLLNVLPPVCGG
ncbi:MAG: MoaD/ThiS family protein [Burkholderiales bacterium]|jgi:hypothetical protein|nr:MoaD/ThiS family protein [Burkholderiales bacterium]MBP9769565.1 MoaD/ThiS family protein [Burkholderiales bacterium]